MKFRLFVILLLILSCSSNLNSSKIKKTYAAKGFAYIYNDADFNDKIIKGKMNNDIMQISHQYLRVGTLIKISNPKNKKSIVLRNKKKIKYPEFYKILITKSVAEKLDLKKDLPLIELVEVKKNKSFVAKKAKMFNEEKKVPTKAPVTSVQISNISKAKKNNDKKNIEKIYILIGSFYSFDTAEFLKQRIIKDLKDINNKKIKIKKINEKKTQVISGPYTSVNLLKNDYIEFKSLGFEELDIFINE